MPQTAQEQIRVLFPGFDRVSLDYEIDNFQFGIQVFQIPATGTVMSYRSCPDYLFS